MAMLVVICLILPVSQVQAASLKLINNGKSITYTGKQLKAVCNDKAVNISKTPGIIENGSALMPYVEVFNKGLGVSTSYNSKKKTITMKYNSNTLVMTLNQKTALLNGKKTTMSLAPRIITYKNSNTKKVAVPSRFTAESLGFSYNYTSGNSTVSIKKKSSTTTGMKIQYNGKTQNYTKKKVNIIVGDKKLSTNMPGLIINDVALLPANAVFAGSSLKADYNYDSSTKKVTISRGKNKIQMTLGSKTAYVNNKKKTMTQEPLLVKNMSSGKSYVMVPGQFTANALNCTYSWNNNTATSTIVAAKTPTASTNDELKAMWISYLEFGATAKSESQFKSQIDKMFTNCVSLGMDTVIVQVRPFSDAMYESKYFPWSAYVSGTQGKDPGYDPLEYMVDAAHSRGLRIEAWLNPYRVTLGSTDINKVSKDSIARQWYTSTDPDTKRNVLSYNKQLYYNPAKKEVQNLIINGVKEIVTNYDVDGIHLDDYFYPSFSSSNVNTAFDAKEYKESGSTLSIADWRRNNVSTLVKKIYTAVKDINEDVVFGISPAGNLSNLRSNLQHYVDIDKWMTTEGYIDYITPQIYWGFENGQYSFDKMLDQWTDLNSQSKVKLYVGIPNYKAGSSDTDEWKNNDDILKRQIIYSRNTKKIDGFVFFRYDDFYSTRAKKETENLLKVLN